ncbi:MAG TPA: MFS transporter [Spirochaetota bacterium]|nr:MFS transporter [Spirochaetota bacterium]
MNTRNESTQPEKIMYDRNVILTGFTSFSTDVSSEMIYPLIQAFVAMIMSAQKALLGPVLGVIEGIAESTASLIKVFAGYYSDRIEKRKAPAIAGYSLSAVSKALLFAASAGWVFVLLSRFFDRVGKGIRTAPRDALISESMPKELQGKAFGFQRAMDFAGAFLGTVVCYFVVVHFMDPVTETIRDIDTFYLLFLISIVPAFIGVVFLFFTRETAKTASGGNGKPKPNLDIRKYDKNLRIFFIAQLIFTLGNSSNQFLLLRSMDLGYVLSTVILMYIIFNLTTTALSSAFGSLSDRIGRKKLLMAGYLLYAAVYIAFGFISNSSSYLLWIFWPLYGLYYAMTEGVEKAFVADIAPENSRATALGFYHTIIGIGLLPASVAAGLLFKAHPGLPFIFGGFLAVLTVLILGFGVKEKA